MTEHFAEWIAGMGPQIADHLWQSTAVVLAAWLVTLALRANQARVRHAIWLAASIKFLVPFALLIAAGNLLPHPKQAVAPVVYSAMDVVEEPFAQSFVPLPPPVVHVPTIRERAEAVMPLVLFALWVMGAGVVVFRWTRSWRVVRRTLHEAQVVDDGREWEILRRVEGSIRTVELRLSEERMEPGIYGVWRPVLVWPRELSARLDDAHIEAIVAHELAHVRRHDNLSAALHMLVESIFWFHPAVWWMERQMVKEREQACDEAVVTLSLSVEGGQVEIFDPSDMQTSYAETYAEALLKTCRFCIESPLPCVAGVTGADLRQRVVEIVTGRGLLRMSWPKKILISAAAVCVVAAPVVLGQAKAAQRLMQAAMNAAPKPVQAVAKVMMAEVAKSDAGDAAQTASATDNTDPEMSLGPAFEVAVIRPADRNDGRRSFGSMVDASGRFTGSAVTLSSLVWYAYANQPLKARVSGGPKWADSDFFDVNAKIDAAYMDGWNKLTTEQRMARLRPMVRTLLVQRFRLKLHAEMLPTPVYALVQAKGGAKMKEVPTPEAVDYDPESTARWRNEHPNEPRPGSISCGPGPSCIGTAIRISSAIGQIQGSAHSDRMVVDETGLKGYYNFMPMPRHDDEDAMQQISDALGLKFEPRTMPVKTYVIDSAEKPSVDGSEVGSMPLMDYLALNADEGAQLNNAYRKWLGEDVHWLITPEERADFLKLTTDKDRDAFIESFWEKRNPPGAAKDAYKEEIYTRIAYANDGFSLPGKPGWASDRGRAVIQFGKPDSIEAHPGDNAPYQIWFYRNVAGLGAVSLHFARSGDDYRLADSWPQANAPAQTRSLASFAAATIKPPDLSNNRHPVSFYGKPGGLVFYGGSARMLIEYAFGLHTYQVIGGPDWIAAKQLGPDWFEINAVPPDNSSSRNIKVANAEPTPEQRQMLQSLLRERFGLKYHFETKEGEVYVLTRGTKPLQFVTPKDTNLDPRAIVLAKGSDERPGVFYDGEALGSNTTTDYLATRLGQYLQMPVINQTGIGGAWDFHLAIVDPDNQKVQDAVNSVVDRLGLKIQRSRGPIQTLVIDHIDHPTEN